MPRALGGPRREPTRLLGIGVAARERGGLSAACRPPSAAQAVSAIASNQNLFAHCICLN